MRGILLTNIGSPQSSSLYDVWKYLTEFLLDKRVINKPYFLRQLLVRGCIVPSRLFTSSCSYKKIWSDEGSPLVAYSRRLVDKLQEALGEEYIVSCGMRYQKPSIQEALHTLQQHPLRQLFILPLFPQYASATTGSSCEEIMRQLARWDTIPAVASCTTFATYAPFINAIAAKAAQFPLATYDKFLFSFHGLPESQAKKEPGYAKQCIQTAESLIERLQLNREDCHISFQSRLGRSPWLQPYTQEVIAQLAQQGTKRLLLFTPSFVTDCLETLYEIDHEYAAEFREQGGEQFDRVPSLNDDPEWVVALKHLIVTIHQGG